MVGGASAIKYIGGVAQGDAPETSLNGHLGVWRFKVRKAES